MKKSPKSPKPPKSPHIFICNNSRCREKIRIECCLTGCEHIFCAKCHNSYLAMGSKCPKCNKSERYKRHKLANSSIYHVFGLSPEEIMEISIRGIEFWYAQEAYKKEIIEEEKNIRMEEELNILRDQVRGLRELGEGGGRNKGVEEEVGMEDIRDKEIIGNRDNIGNRGNIENIGDRGDRENRGYREIRGNISNRLNIGYKYIYENIIGENDKYINAKEQNNIMKENIEGVPERILHQGYNKEKKNRGHSRDHSGDHSKHRNHSTRNTLEYTNILTPTPFNLRSTISNYTITDN